MTRLTSTKAALTAAMVLSASGILMPAGAEDLTIPELLPPMDHPAYPAKLKQKKVAVAQTLPTAPADVKAASALPAASTAAAESPPEKIPFKPGQTLSIDTAAEDIVPTYDIELAKRQVAAFPDNPEAAFILAVALTRTSRVEEALKEVQRARRLAEKQGGANYFDKMIGTYEKMLSSYPEDNQVRYGLAWAYYMKAYLLAKHSRKVAAWKAANQPGAAAAPAVKTPDPTAQALALATKAGINGKDLLGALNGNPAALANVVSGAQAVANTPGAVENIPHIPGALEKVDAADIPQIKTYFDQAIKKLDEILQRDPKDVWSTVYAAHLRAEYTGNLGAAMHVWKATATKYPNNPAPYFFLGEGYLKQGNLRESINNVSRAISLRAIGN